jgi:hypothetical protein
MTALAGFVPTAASSSSSLDLHPSSDIAISPAHFLLPPPQYSPSTTAPEYSVEPGPSEQRLALAVRSRPAPRGIVRRSHSGITVALRDQDESAEHPTYGRRGMVAGDVELANAQNVTSVTAMVRFHSSCLLPVCSKARFLRTRRLKAASTSRSAKRRRSDGRSCPRHLRYGRRTARSRARPFSRLSLRCPRRTRTPWTSVRARSHHPTTRQRPRCATCTHASPTALLYASQRTRLPGCCGSHTGGETETCCATWAETNALSQHDNLA